MKFDFKGSLLGGLQQYTTVDMTHSNLHSVAYDLENHSDSDYQQLVLQAQRLADLLYSNISAWVSRTKFVTTTPSPPKAKPISERPTPGATPTKSESPVLPL